MIEVEPSVYDAFVSEFWLGDHSRDVFFLEI